jgi:hypothetical protein
MVYVFPIYIYYPEKTIGKNNTKELAESLKDKLLMYINAKFMTTRYYGTRRIDYDLKLKYGKIDITLHKKEEYAVQKYSIGLHILHGFRLEDGKTSETVEVAYKTGSDGVTLFDCAGTEIWPWCDYTLDRLPYVDEPDSLERK